jgi:peptide/nickel transport system substrate-binding protein
VEKFEGNHTILTEEAMPATGPFLLKQWRTGKDIIIQRNPDHFRKGEPHLDGWVTPWGLFEDPNASRIAFEQKQTDFWSSPDASVTKAVIDAHKDDMREVLTGVANTVYLHLNMNKQFKDIRLVKAMNMAIDRRVLIQKFHQGLGQVSGPVTWLQEGFAVKPDDLIKYPGYRTNRELEIKEARDLWSAGSGPQLGDVDIKSIDTWTGPWPDTPQILIQMFNEALGVSQFKSTRGTYNEDVIPLLAKGEFANWMAWTNQVNSPDPRNDLYANFHSAGSTNFQHVNNPELDTLLTDALLTADLNQAKQLSLKAQDILLNNAQYGNVVLYNYISRSASWNYFHGNNKVAASPGKPGQGYNIFGGHLVARTTYIDPSDPSYSDGVKNRSFG